MKLFFFMKNTNTFFKSFTLFLLVFFCSSLSYASPRIFVENGPVYDFGTSFQNQTITHIFVIKNTGDTTLKITKVKTSCGCTAALLSKKDVEPGQEVKLKVSLRTGYYDGDISKNVTIHSDDLLNPSLGIVIKALVKPEIRLTPKVISYKKSDNKNKYQIQLTNNTDYKVEIKSIDSTLNFLHIMNTSAFIDPGKTGAFDVEFDKEKINSNFSGRISILTNVKNRELYNIFINGGLK